MCGEHVEIPHGHVGLQGSSPHVRGAPALRRASPMSLGDHPRMCGEHQASKGAE